MWGITCHSCLLVFVPPIMSKCCCAAHTNVYKPTSSLMQACFLLHFFLQTLFYFHTMPSPQWTLWRKKDEVWLPNTSAHIKCWPPIYLCAHTWFWWDHTSGICYLHLSCSNYIWWQIYIYTLWIEQVDTDMTVIVSGCGAHIWWYMSPNYHVVTILTATAFE